MSAILDKQMLRACREGNLEEVARLYDLGAKVGGVYDESLDAFLSACVNGHAHVVKYLLGKGVSPYAVDKNGLSAIGWAIVTKHQDVVDALWEKDREGRKLFKDRPLVSDFQRKIDSAVDVARKDFEAFMKNYRRR